MSLTTAVEPDGQYTWIDVELRARAVPVDYVLSTLRSRELDRLRQLEKSRIYIPYPTIECEMIVTYDKACKPYFLVKLDTADLRITHYYKDKMMYLISEPFVVKDFTMYAVFNFRALFIGFTCYPQVGFHFYAPLSPKWSLLCVGEGSIAETTLKAQKTTPELEQVKKIGQDVRKSLGMINTHSLGAFIGLDEENDPRIHLIGGRLTTDLVCKGYIKPIL